MFPQWLHQFQQWTRIPFSHHPPHQGPGSLYDQSKWSRHEVISHHGFDLHFPEVKHLLMYLLPIWMSLGKCLFSSSGHFSIRLCFVNELCEFFFNILWILMLYQINYLQMVGCLFILLMMSFL